MSISFSGLASGLDTSSWVESLTALKRAKVETYTAEKEKVMLSQSTLNSIKSFFASFRSTIEKITDTRFGIASMDLFSQHLATSSNVNVLTATANHEADEGVYTIDVNQLATKTQAASKYSHTTTKTITATATLDSTLNTLGVKAGNIGVTINGIERKINLTNTETIQSFTDKLNNIGAQASYNETTGRFSVNLGVSAFNDIDNTGILNALHLSGVNEGYVTNSLQLKHVDTEFNVATKDTKLLDLGVKFGTITVEANSQSYDISIGLDTTIGDFVNKLTSKNIEAKFTDDGYFVLEDAKITNERTTNIIEALGLQDSEVYSSSQTSKQLSYGTTLVETTVADRNTLLKEIGDGITVKNNDTVIVSNSSGKSSTITVSSTTTVGQLLDKLNTAGLSANIDKNGVVSISDGSIVGGTFDIKSAFNLNETVSGKYTTSTSLYISTTTAIDMTSSSQLTYGVNKFATLSDKVFDFISGASGTVKVVTTDESGALNTINVINTTTFSDLFSKLSEVGITGNIADGVISLSSSSGAYVKSGLESLGVRASTTTTVVTTTVGTTKSSTQLLYQENKAAVGTDKVFDFISGASGTLNVVTTDESGALNTINVTSTTSFNDLFSKLSEKGIQASLFDGVISFNSSTGAYVKSGLEGLGVSAVTNTTTVTTTVGTTKSSEQLSYYESKAATRSDTVFSCKPLQFGGGNSPFVIETFDGIGNRTGLITVTETTTFGDLFNALGEKGIQGSLSADGVISLTSPSGAYIKGMEAYGITTTVTTVYATTTVGTTKITEQFTYEGDVTAEINDSIYDFVEAWQTNPDYNGVIQINDSHGEYKSITLNHGATFASLFNQLQQYGINASMNDGVISIWNNDEYYLYTENFGTPNSINIAAELGITSTTTTITRSNTVGTSVTSSQQTIGETQYAQLDSKVNDYVNFVYGNSIIVRDGLAGISNSDDTSPIKETITVDNNMTFRQLFAKLANWDINATLSEDGIISFENTSDYYISNEELAKELGITASPSNVPVTNSISKTTGILTYGGGTRCATASDKIGDFLELTGDDYLCLQSIRNSSSNCDGSMKITATTTFSGLFDYLSNFGIEASLDSEGCIVFGSEHSEWYISGGSVAHALDIVATSHGYTTVKIGMSSTLFPSSTTIDKYANMEELGCAGKVICLAQEGTSNTAFITLESTDTLVSLEDKLGDYNIMFFDDVRLRDDGTALLVEYGKIEGASNSRLDYADLYFPPYDSKGIGWYVVDYGGAFGLYGKGYSEQEVRNLYNSGYSSPVDLEGGTQTVTSSTTMDELGQTGTIKVITTKGDTYFINATGSKTVGDVLNELGEKGLTASLSSDGKITIKGGSISHPSGSYQVLVEDFGGVFGLTGKGYSVANYNNPQNSSSEQLSDTVPVAATLNSTLSDIGTSGTIKVHYQGKDYEVVASGDKTVSQVFDELRGYGVNCSMSNGVIRFTPTTGSYLTGFGGVFGLTGGRYNVLEEEIVSGYNGSYGDTTSKWSTFKADETTTMGQIGKTGNIVVQYGGMDYTINASATKKISEVFRELSTYGISGSITDGVVTITGTSSGCVKDFGGAFGLTGSAYSQDITTTYSGYNSSSYTLNHVVETKANGNSTMDQIGQAGNIVVNSGGQTYTVNASGDKTLSEVFRELSAYGVSGSVSDGVITITGTTNGFVTDFGGVFGLTGSAYSASTSSTVSGYNPSSNNLTHQVITRANGNSTMSQLGRTGNIVVNSGGQYYTVNASGDKTVSEVFRELSAYGISGSVSNGVVTIAGTANGFVENFGGAFGLNGSAYSTSTTTTVSGRNPNSNQLSHNVTEKVNDSTTLSQLGLTSNGVVVVNENGSYNTVTLTSNLTMAETKDLLNSHGINLSYIDGKVTLAGSNGSFITNVSSEIKSAFKFNTSGGSGTSYQVSQTPISSSTSNVKLSELKNASGTDLGITSGNIYAYQNGVRNTVSISTDDTLESLASKFSRYGIQMSIGSDGKLYLNASDNSYLSTSGMTSGASNVLSKLGIDFNNWTTAAIYNGSAPVEVTTTSDIIAAASRDTKLSDLGISTGEFYIYENGVRNTVYVSSDDTLGDFIDTLRSFGLQTSLTELDNGTSILKTLGKGESYVTNSANTSNRSNIVDKLFGTNSVETTNSYRGYQQTSTLVTTYTNATEETLLSEFDNESLSWKAVGDLNVKVNGESMTVKIAADETIGSLLDKFRSLGLEATLSDGEIMIQSGFDTLNITSAGSGLLKTIGLAYRSDLGGYAATAPNKTVKSTTTVIETHTNSVANYANGKTKLSLLNISSGTLTIYRDGEKAIIDVNENWTFDDLKGAIAAKLKDVTLSFDNGYLTIASNREGAEVVVGATTDNSNFSAITGILSEGGKAVSSRALYCVNGDSVVTQSSLFVAGTVKEGYFVVGNAQINIDNTTTINDIISQINYSDDSAATAYWDAITGSLVIKSKNSGASLINIEAGTTNFTDIMGYTSNKDGVSRMNLDAQELGKNASFRINGTTFVSASNTVTSDVTKIKGVTLNLKDISNAEEPVTLTIEKDKETAANAVSDIVDAYNALIENVDKEIAKDGNLNSESTLKLLRNQIRSLMTSSIAGSGTFRNLNSVGITLATAYGGNIRTDNIDILNFDKDKFADAFGADTKSMKALLVGDDTNKGILTMVEDVLEQSLGGVTGYFASADKAYNNKINRLDAKIDAANKAVDRYKARLEAKFKVMDRLISNVQNNYSSFLGS